VIKEIVSAIHVRQVQTSIGRAEPFTRASRVGEVAAHMDRLQHDVTPILPNDCIRDHRAPSAPDGTLSKVDLKGMDPHDAIRAVVRPLSSDVLIDSSANLF
jgi:hypothetical protein